MSRTKLATGYGGGFDSRPHDNRWQQLDGMLAELYASAGSGPGGAGFTYDRAVAGDVWNVEHGLGRRPSVTVVDSGGREVEGDVVYVDDNNVTITFSAAFAGSAYFN